MTEAAAAGSWLASIVKNGRWYLFSSVTTKGLALLTLTILTHHLPPDEFGALNTLIALTQALPIVLSLYMDAALARLYHEYRHDQEELALLFSSAFWFVLIWGSLSLMAFSLFFPALGTDIRSMPVAYIWTASVPVLLLQLAQLGMVFLRQSFESRKITRMEIWSALIGVTATYIAVATWDQGIFGRLCAIALSSAYMFLHVFLRFSSAGLLVFRFDFSKLTACLAFSIPLLPNLIAGWIVSTSDRLIIAQYVNLKAVGVYSLAATVASLLYVVQDAVTQVTGVKTQIGMSTHRERTLKMIGDLSIVMWVVMLFANYCAIAYSVQFIRLFTGTGYMDAAGLIGVCGFVYVLSPQNRILQDIVSFHKKTWIISSSALVMAVCSLALNFALAPRFGQIAAPYVFIAATAIQAAWLYGWVYRLEQLSLPWGKMATALTVYLAFVLIDRMADSLLAKIFASLAYAAVTWKLLAPNIKALRD